MNDVSIKVLDALFDLCEGEGYSILEAEEITSRISYYEFAKDELTEILEALVADGLIDLKYADNKEFCVAMRTKGRTLIKQSRERLSKLIEEDPELATYREEKRAAEADQREKRALEEEKERLKKEREERLRLAHESFIAADGREEKLEKKQELEVAKEKSKEEEKKIEELEARIDEVEQREKSRSFSHYTRGFYETQNAPAESVHKDPKNAKTFLFALLGAAVGAAIINLIFLIIILVKVC